MMPLILHELKRLLKHPVPWILLVIVTLGSALTWQSLASEESLEMKARMDPIARYQLQLAEDPELKEQEEALITIERALDDPDRSDEERLLLEEKRRSHLTLLTGGFLDEWYQHRYPILTNEADSNWLTAEPDHAEEFSRLKGLMALARDENLKARAFPYLDHGMDFSAYTLRLFHFSQSGLLILSALILGVMSARIPEGPLFRKTGSWQIIVSRITALVTAAVFILILPRVAASLIMGIRHGFGYLDLVIPFNPQSGFPLFLESAMEPSSLIRTPFTSIRADSLIRLGAAFILMYAYEIAQLFLWLSIGLLLGAISRRNFISFGIPLSIMLLAGIAAPLLQSQFSGLLFPVYQDAVRDVLGGSYMLTGYMITEAPPQDYTTGLAVMVISGLAALYLADLRQKSLHRSVRKGEPDETL